MTVIAGKKFYTADFENKIIQDTIYKSCNFDYCDLSTTTFINVDFINCSLNKTIGDGKVVISGIEEGFEYVIAGDMIRIGCKEHPRKKWKKLIKNPMLYKDLLDVTDGVIPKIEIALRKLLNDYED